MNRKEQWITRKMGMFDWRVIYISPKGVETDHKTFRTEKSANKERDRLRSVYGSTCEQE